MDGENSHSRLLRTAANRMARLRLLRREPWNWCAQNAGLAFLAAALLTHSAWFFSLAAMGIFAGCVRLPLPPMRYTEFARLEPRIETLIGKEAAWLASPLDRRKKRRIALLAIGVPLAAWLLWTRDVGPLGLAAAVVCLVIVRRRNIKDGIDP